MRHGHVDYFAPNIATIGGVRDISLTLQGREEAKAAALALSAVVLDRVFCSSLPRARQTAEIVVEHQSQAKDVEVEPALSEIHGGRLLDVSNRSELIATMVFHFARRQRGWSNNAGRGGSFCRCPGTCSRRRSAHPRRIRLAQILIVAHEGINRLILSWAAGTGLLATSAFEQDTGLHQCHRFRHGAGRGRFAGPRDRAGLSSRPSISRPTIF